MSIAGSENFALYGQYVFGAWSQDWNVPSGRIFFARPPAGGYGRWDFQSIDIADLGQGPIPYYVLGFGQDNAGELYVLTTDSLGPSGTTGSVYRLTSG